MKTVNIAEAKARLPELVESAARGDVVILARAGKPRAKLVPLDADDPGLRKPGKGKGRFRMRKGFDAPLPEEVLQLFERRGTSMKLLPFDRMLVAQAILEDLVIVSDDATLRSYPAPVVWD